MLWALWEHNGCPMPMGTLGAMETPKGCSMGVHGSSWGPIEPPGPSSLQVPLEAPGASHGSGSSPCAVNLMWILLQYVYFRFVFCVSSLHASLSFHVLMFCLIQVLRLGENRDTQSTLRTSRCRGLRPATRTLATDSIVFPSESTQLAGWIFRCDPRPN